ncbi:hypothetical protein [Bradyrhizobium roseum]|uniref:hypothetical protein n=1 Tax=Bradyrhizobium roseum TaxID=3056648 RepID=UPI0026106656|nr:hypothetical protein [Bradyrhizobium roseus]WKA26368.1 hypothetical protein QUH67_22525 [Bradyrhizobium roseus]
MKMPLYLGFDLAGKAFILISVGVQLLILTPNASQRAVEQVRATISLEYLSVKAHVKQLGIDPKLLREPFHKDIVEEINDDLDLVDRLLGVGGAYQNNQLSYPAILTMLMFAVGTVLTIAGTYLEKRNKPAP